MNEIVKFFYKDIRVDLPQKIKLKNFVKSIFKEEKKNLSELKIIFCRDEYLLQLNKSFLNHDTLTDIITFNLSKRLQNIDSEIYISIERVKENCLKFNMPFLYELYNVIFHGVLHLCGYNDKTKDEVKEMRKKEKSYLSKYLNMFHVKQS